MGSVSLVCPMCCGETFDNSQSLKYHLLSMTDNLYCPNCSERSDSVAALIQHLDCCGDSMDVANGLSEIDETEVSVDTKGDGTNHNYLATVNEDGMVVVGHLPAMNDPNEHIIDKMDIDDNTEDNDDILEHLDEIGDIDIPKNEVEEDIEEVKLREKRIKDENSSSETIDNETELIEGENNREISNFGEIDPLEETADEEVAEEEQNETELVQVKQEICEVESEALYSCSSCSMSFNSVLSHIKEYHDGQEVVLEMAEQQMEDLPEESNDFEAMVDENQSTNSSRATKESSSIGERASVGTGTSGGVGLPRQRQTMNTLRTEECVDSEGRLYTRKVVQIERFWDRGSSAATGAQSQLQQQQHQQATKSSPMIEKFFSNAEGLKIRAKSPGIPVTNSPIVVTSTTTTTTMTNTTTNAVENCNDTSARHQLRMYRCNKCLEQFVKLAEFRVHACIHGNNRCELCDQAFASVKALQLHSRIHEVETEGGNDNNFVCQTCGTEFTSHKSLRLHSRMHAPVRARHVDAPEGTSNEIFTCIECGKTLSESYRKAHMALHKGDSVTCTVCNRKFDSAESLAMHAAVHLEFGNSQNHKFHQTTEDRKDDESNKDGLKSGKGKKNDKSGGGDAQEKPYQCQHCGRRFTRPHEKVKHERIHTGEKPHACEVCGKTFRVSYCLTLHMRTHTGVRPYACQHCGKRFKASSVYNHHLLTHGEERAYTCPYCPKTFKTRVQLAGHKNSHTKPFRCTECSRPFASLYAARAHIQTHKKDNNLKFSCYICGASYGRAFALKDHLKQHTGQDVLATPEASREEEVADADDFLINEETEEYEEIEEIEENEEVEEEEIKLVAVAAAAAAGNANVEIHKLNLIDSHEQTQ